MNLPVGCKLIGVGAAVPATVVTNADLEKLVDTSDEWITTRTGIKERRVVTEEETACGLATEAAKDAIAFAGIDPVLIDLIIVATSTPDNLYPSTACVLQAAIGSSRAAAFDLEAACSGIVYALAVAQQFIGSGMFKTVLICGVDLHSRFLNWEDRNTCILFGDGAGALLLSAAEEGQNDILATYLRADGTGAHLLKIPNSGVNYPRAGATPEKQFQRFLHMNGRAIYEFAINAVPEAVHAVCARAGIRIDDIDYFIPHQANKRIIKATAERLGIPEHKWVCNLDEYGNTSAASIPLAIYSGVRSGQIKPPATCLLVGFGGGLTWASAIIRWTARDKREGSRSSSEGESSKPGASAHTCRSSSEAKDSED